MATYFHGGSELQAAASADGTTMQTLYLMNPSSAAYVPFSDTSNMLFLNPAGAHPHALSSAAFTHVPMTASMLTHSSEDPGRATNYLWGISMEQSSPGGVVHDNTPAWQLGLRQTISGIPAAQSPRRQGLSLSLLDNNNKYNNNNSNMNDQMGQQLMAVSGNSPSSTSVSVVSNSVVLRSKYLRAAQEVLEEVVSVGKGIIKSGEVSTMEGTKEKMIKTSSFKEPVGDQSMSSNDKRTAELTTAQRQDLLMKKAKLLKMLDEVELRYKQYHQQMQMVVATFEQGAGLGSARSYTAVALQTISKQFRCLKDAIEGQIKATSQSLGEEECTGAKLEGSRLRLVDQQLRQQRALQQLGMMHQNAWRPQRGLPERAVSVLRAWLFEHFLHPYPKDSDKALLAKQTGLTRGQVSNWFINARVRLWKPMVEEMYLEEMKEQTKNGGGHEDSIKNTNPNPNPNRTQKEQQNTNKPEPDKPGINRTTSTQKIINSSHHEFNKYSTISSSPLTSPLQQSFNRNGSSDPDRVLQRSPKKSRGSSEMQGSFYSSTYGGYAAMEQLAGPSFHGNGGVSLTLGLPHGENLSLSGNQQSFLSSHHHNIQLGRRLQLGPQDSDFCGISSAPAAHSVAGTGYENLELQNRTKEFAAQLLPDFVA